MPLASLQSRNGVAHTCKQIFCFRHQFLLAVTKSGTGTWDVGLQGGAGTWERGTRERDVGCQDVGTWRRGWFDDKLSSILDYLTLDRQKLHFSNSTQKSGVVCLSVVLESPCV